MNIYALNGEKVKIRLTNAEMTSFFGIGEINYNSRESRLVFSMLLYEALPETEPLLECKSLSVEIRYVPGGCEIVFAKGKPNRGRRRSVEKKYMFEFLSCEQMIKAVTELYSKKNMRRLKSRLYKMPKSYRLIISAADFCITAVHLGEYCERSSQSDTEISFTEEYGHPLSQDRAVEELGRAFSKSS